MSTAGDKIYTLFYNYVGLYSIIMLSADLITVTLFTIYIYTALMKSTSINCKEYKMLQEKQSMAYTSTIT